MALLTVGALHDAGIESGPVDETGLQAYTADLEQIGDIALAAGLPVHELRAQEQNLEALFFELTSQPDQQNRNLGTVEAAGGGTPQASPGDPAGGGAR